jgi:transposase
LKEEETLSLIASRHGVHPNLLRKWKAQALEGLPKLFADDKPDKRTLEAEHQRRLDELYGEIGRLTTQLAWLNIIWPRTLRQAQGRLWPALSAGRCWSVTNPSWT